MDTNDYLQLFIEESQEHLQAISDNLLALEKTPTDLEIVNTIFRSAHTLKGMAGAMHYENMAHLTHEMESNLDELRSGRLQVTDDVLDVLFESHDVLQHQLELIVNSGSDEGVETDTTIKKIQSLAGGQIKSPAAGGSPMTAIVLDEVGRGAVQNVLSAGSRVYSIAVTISPDSPMPSVRGFMVKRAYEEIGEVITSDPPDPASDEFDGTLRLIVATELDEPAVRYTGNSITEVANVVVEPLQSIQAGAEVPTTAVQVETTAPVGQTTTLNAQSKTVRVDVDRLDTLMTLYSEFVIDKTRLEQLASTRNDTALTDTVQHLSHVGADLQDIIMKIRMVPLETVFNRFPRMIRDLSKSLNKKVNLVVSGADTEIDRVLSDEIADPLVHILRNSMDHGLETPEERIALAKVGTGTIQLTAYQAGNHVFIEIQDDGRGIHRDKVLRKAIDQGLVPAERAESLRDEEVFGAPG